MSGSSFSGKACEGRKGSLVPRHEDTSSLSPFLGLPSDSSAVLRGFGCSMYSYRTSLCNLGDATKGCLKYICTYFF